MSSHKKLTPKHIGEKRACLMYFVLVVSCDCLCYGKSGTAVQFRKPRYWTKASSCHGIDDAIAKYVFDKLVKRNGYVNVPDNIDRMAHTIFMR